jgi:hypothetical protein
MSLNPDYDGIVTLRPYPNGAEAEPPAELPAATTVESAAPAAPAVDQAPMWAPPELNTPVQAIEPVYRHEVPQEALQLPPPPVMAPSTFVAPARPRSRPRWVVPAAIGAIGIIASGTLGYFLWSTTGQRDVARHQLASTQSTLAATESQLTSAQADATARKATADYVRLYVADGARVLTDDENMNICKGYSQCRTAAQQAMTDMQLFQFDRGKASVPTALANSDAMLGDALSAEIAAVQQVINGMDNNNVADIRDGWAKLDRAMLSMGKAEAALGAGLK